MDFSDDEDLDNLDLDRIEEEATKPCLDRSNVNVDAEVLSKSATSTAASGEDHPANGSASRCFELIDDEARESSSVCPTCSFLQSVTGIDALSPQRIAVWDRCKVGSSSTKVRDGWIKFFGVGFEMSSCLTQTHARFFRLFFQRVSSLIASPDKGVWMNGQSLFDGFVLCF